MNKVIVGSTTVSGNVNSKNKHLRQKLPIAILGVLIVIALIIFVIYLNNNRNNKKVPAKPPLSQAALIQEVDKDNLVKHYQTAINLIESQHVVSGVEKQSLLATTYANEGKLSQALAIYATLAKQHQLTQNLAEQAASLAIQANNTTLAISYYQQAVVLSKNNKHDPVSGADANYDRQQIQSLQQGSQ